MLKALYSSRTGGYVLKLITRPGFSRKCAGVLDSHYSRVYIKHFIHKNNIDMSDYVNKRWHSFNDFFTRAIKPGARPIDMSDNSLISPCDGFLSVYNITENCSFTVKGAEYTLPTLLANEKLAREYENGLCFLFRMMPINYHRYIYPDWGNHSPGVSIPGKLHTVRPMAHGRYRVYTTNSREYTVLSTRNFGDIVFMEVGALMVGRIRNHYSKHAFSRGEEKGFFEYGGSTILMLVKKDTVIIDEKFEPSIGGENEIPVKMGSRVGVKQ